MNILETIKILWFCISFYFTILRFVSGTKLFEIRLNSLTGAMAIRETRIWVLINWIMWFYQIYFWFNYLKVI